jgi:hypothetical protein
MASALPTAILKLLPPNVLGTFFDGSLDCWIRSLDDRGGASP